MKTKHLVSLVLLVFLLSSSASAHQPKVVLDMVSSLENPIGINEPEVSKAFYGELDGSPDYYIIYAEKPFDFYVNILSPDIPGYDRTDISVEVSYASKALITLEGSNATWAPYYEEYAGDDYLKGPEERVGLPEGTYYIKVYSPDDRGRYCLVVGEEERFPLTETVNALVSVPVIKQRFFGKSPVEAYMNTSGLVLIVLPVAVIVALLYLIIKVKKKRKKKR